MVPAEAAQELFERDNPLTESEWPQWRALAEYHNNPINQKTVLNDEELQLIKNGLTPQPRGGIARSQWRDHVSKWVLKTRSNSIKPTNKSKKSKTKNKRIGGYGKAKKTKWTKHTKGSNGNDHNDSITRPSTNKIHDANDEIYVPPSFQENDVFAVPQRRSMSKAAYILLYFFFLTFFGLFFFGSNEKRIANVFGWTQIRTKQI